MHTLLLSSGGIKGFAFLGVKKYLEEHNINIKTFSGVSIGAFFSMWFALGFTFKEIYKLTLETNILNLFSFDFVNFFETYGMIETSSLENFIIQRIEEKNFDKTITFQELFDKTQKNLHTYAFCVDDQELCLFSKETTPNCPIIVAVMMSMSIPFIFQPVKYQGKLYVDGAIKNGFPIKEYNPSQTIPCILVNEDIKTIKNIFHYTFKIVLSVLQHHELEYACCIYSDVNSLDVSIDKEQIDNMIQKGYKSLMTWMSEDDLS